MSNAVISIITALAGMFLAGATFFIGRTTNAKHSGEEQGEIKADLKHIREDISEMKTLFGRNFETIIENLSAERKERLSADQRIHDRIDAHIKDYHKS